MLLNLVFVSIQRRFVVFWDIPTGKCDQKHSKKNAKETMFYRPAWLGQDCLGTSHVLEVDPAQTFVAVGSDDGYVFAYDFITGLPPGRKRPAVKHNGKVYLFFIFI